MRKITFAPGEYYHIYNRGAERKDLFINQRDYARFLFIILHFQSPLLFTNISRHATKYLQNKTFGLSPKKLKYITETRNLELIAFTIMPNHFHLLIKELSPDGITGYMQRILTAYAMYFNKKYETSGHVFQGPFGAVHIESDAQLLYLSCYIHKNQRGIARWKNREAKYPWSSYSDYIKTNRWGDLIKRKSILDSFTNQMEYKNFVTKSSAKNVRGSASHIYNNPK